MNTVTVIIERCSKDFWWYERFVKNRKDMDTPESIAERTFEVELMDDCITYRTVDDVCGPGVKGFILPEDTIIGRLYELNKKK